MSIARGGGDYRRSGYVRCVPVISANVPFTYYVQVKMEMKMASDVQ